MGWLPSSPGGIAMRQGCGIEGHTSEEDSEIKDMTIGVDLAKRVFQPHGTWMTGEVKFRKKLSRDQFRAFIPSSSVNRLSD
jgi:transposase